MLDRKVTGLLLIFLHHFHIMLIYRTEKGDDDDDVPFPMYQISILGMRNGTMCILDLMYLLLLWFSCCFLCKLGLNHAISPDRARIWLGKENIL